MRISEVHIANFRALRDFHLVNAPDLVVLAGPNGTGKSTVLEAVALWKEALAPYYSGRNAGRDAVSKGADRAEIEITVEMADDELGFWRNELTRRGQTPPEGGMTRLTGKVQVLPDGRVEGSQWTGGDSGFAELLSQLDRTLPVGVMEYIGPYRRLPPADIQSIPLVPITPERERQTRLYDVESKFNEVKQYLLALEVQDWQRYYHNEGDKEDSSREVKDLFEAFFSPKKLLGARSVDTPQGPRLKLLVQTPAGVHDIDNLSSGEKEILMVFATLYRLRLRNSVLLYDEPDLHLNAALERKVVPQLMSMGKGNQIWVSTHSLEMIDSTPLENLFVLSHYTGQNQVRPAQTDRDRIALFQFLGASTGVQLISERVVFIEGEDSSADKEILKEVFADHRHQVSFIPSGGVTTLESVGRRGVELWQEASRHGQFFLVRDRDSLSDGEVDRLQQDLQGRVWVWKRYHIENYLLDWCAIHRALRRAGVHSFDSAEKVEARLKEIADSLREETIARWVGADLNRQIGWQDFRITGGSDPIHQLEQSAEGASQRIQARLQIENVRTQVDEKRAALSTWDAGLWRDLVPGKRLLRLFVGGLNAGLSYERLRSLILAEMKEDPSLWPQEFRELTDKVLEGLE